MAREGAFRERVDVDAPAPPRPFQLPTGTRTSFSLNPYGRPQRPSIERFAPGRFVPPAFLTPPHQRSGVSSRKAIDVNSIYRLTKEQAQRYAGLNAKAGLYAKVVERRKLLINGRWDGKSYFTRTVFRPVPEYPAKTSSRYPTSAHLEYAQLRWLWLYDRVQYWRVWKRQVKPRREEQVRDAREEWNARVEQARSKYSKQVAKAMAEYNARLAKWRDWDERMRAQFD